MTERAQWKMTAKMRMSQSDPHYVKVMLLYVLAAVLVPQVAGNIAMNPVADSMERFYELVDSGIDLNLALQALQLSGWQLLATNALSLVLAIYQMVMSFGLVLYCLRLYRGEPCGPADLFAGFSMLGRVLGAEILVTLIVLACTFGLMIPFMGLVFFFIVSLPDSLSWLFVYAAAIAYAVAVIAIVLNYVLTTITLADRPELGAMGAIQQSKNMIKGHRMRYVILTLSFIGWSLLCALPGVIFSLLSGVGMVAGIEAGYELTAIIPDWAVAFSNLPGWLTGVISVVLALPTYLWLTPYMNTAVAGFYDSLQDQGFQPPYPPMPPV